MCAPARPHGTTSFWRLLWKRGHHLHQGMQKYENAEPDTIELVTGGRLEQDGGGFYCLIRRAPSPAWTQDPDHLPDRAEQVTLLRVGKYTSQMVFQEGRRHMSMYNTPLWHHVHRG